MRSSHDAEDLIRIFNSLFLDRHNTILVRGTTEPLYVPSVDSTPAQVIFAHGFFASALHETAHWCIAGQKRRQLRDYGYWYRPDGRTASQQQEFLAAETKPQALERMFSAASGFPFHLSLDNLAGESTDIQAFCTEVTSQIRQYQTTGLPPRAAEFFNALREFFSPADIDFEIVL